ncbi:MAG: creatininase family protein [Deltaproteobacteria bacterium]|nr:creatininase family protein [Deltaproteobacteria bacterium]
MAESTDILSPLRAFRSLIVGPVVLEGRRVRTPYRVLGLDGTGEETELVYRWEEEVFPPGEPGSRNLASLLSAQVALNYGLFCDEIRFRGPYDSADRRFLEGAAGNTAREIYVNKFLRPNPFLTGPAADLPVVRKKSYLRARLVFEPGEAEAAIDRRKRRAWETSPERCAVLSSGGKDSLLSYGLMRELGYEVHPLFVNESGRHWFTALNAYRYLRDHVPETGRVWTNADRVYNWMLRFLPFVRPDHGRVRSDAYPVRLWTVAVFLFGILPLVRRRGIGRILVGDEFDTTRRVTFQGISHFDGLYDQSRHFDESLTRYFLKKGWGVTQFSIVRPLSELLIERILAERYPDLLRLQVSCHAAHKKDEAVRPCGRCEKCRRIVGMLVALGADPGVCGYSDAQVRACLDDLAAGGVHQEKPEAAHLGFLLRAKGVASVEKIGEVPAREHPEVMSVRFDQERSPQESLPADLRAGLYRIWKQHARKSLYRSGRSWIEFDPLEDDSFSRPYRFEKPRSGGSAATEREANGAGPSFLLGGLTWPEAETRFREVDVALLPVGAIEQHGPHLPLDTDAFDADYLARAVARGCTDPKPLVLPLVSYGVSYHHADFPGTIGVTPETLSQIAYDIGMAAARNGVTKLVIINGHGGNGPALQFAAQKINRDAHIFTCVDTGETSDPDINALAETPNDVHAGEIETSTTLAVRPEGVRMDRASRFVPEFSSRYLDFTSKRSVDWYAYTSRLSITGVLGDPTRATREKGERMWALMIRHLVAFVEDLKRLNLDEIYQKRY